MRSEAVERVAWSALLLVNAVLHFAALGSRALSHDESLHAFYSYKLAQEGVYVHDPMMHGPLLFHANALVYAILGASDATSRLLPAVAGVALVGVLFWWRDLLGRTGAFLAGLLLTLSPSLLFYGRYLVHDVYAELLGLVWAGCALRYLAGGGARWLHGMTLAMALSFCNKETTFIFGAILGSYLVLLGAVRRWRHGEPWARSRSGELALVMLTVVLPFLAAFVSLALGHDPGDFVSGAALVRSSAIVAILFVVSTLGAAAALRRRPGSPPGALRFSTWAVLMTSFWTVTAALFTTFFTNPAGLVTGIVGSLGYWLGQHEVGRGSQPWFYYLMLGGLYELLPMLASAAGATALARAVRRKEPVGVVLPLLAWWTGASWIGYSFAGEKMPWLLVHAVVPTCLLGGWWLGRLLSQVAGSAPPSWRTVLLVIAVPACLALGAPLAWVRPFQGRDLVALAATARWLFHLIATVALIVVVARAARPLPRAAVRGLLALGVAAFLALFAGRAALMASFVNEDLATELLVYAHATPDVKRALDEIAEVAARTGAGNRLEVAYDDDSAWPFTWYLRIYPSQRFYGDDPSGEAMRAPVVIVGSKNFEKAARQLDRDYVRRDYRLIWWPLEDYGDVGWSGLLRRLRDPASREWLRQVVLHRHYPGVDFVEWPYRHEFRLYLRRDLVARAWPMGLEAMRSEIARPADQVRIVPELHCDALDSYTGPYAGVPLRGPSGVAVAPDGARLIADTANHRVVVLERTGAFRRAVGSRCDLGGGAAGCIDGDGPGPQRAGDAQFLEPSGVAAGRDGEIVVADTWNGRLQTLDPSGRLLQAWGRLAVGSAPPVAPDRLYGPRAVAYDAGRDRLVVSDTGNKRLIVIGRDGAVLDEVGGPGHAPGRFDEPVGVAIEAQGGHIYVADAWNRRIQRFDAALRPVAEWPVPGWTSRAVADKPYLAVDPQGAVFASDPENARVLVFDAEGRLAVSLVAVGWRGAARARPTGLALDPVARQLLVADPDHGRVWVLPQVDPASPACRPSP